MNTVVDTIADGYREVHDTLRSTLAELEPAALTWTPAPDTNSVTVLIVHSLGSEAEVWRIVAAAPTTRDRPAEFVPRHTSRDDLLARLDAADGLLAELAPRIGEADLAAVRHRGERAPQTGLHWLITNYGHAREHLAHIELTLQMYKARAGGE